MYIGLCTQYIQLTFYKTEVQSHVYKYIDLVSHKFRHFRIVENTPLKMFDKVNIITTSHWQLGRYHIGPMQICCIIHCTIINRIHDQRRNSYSLSVLDVRHNINNMRFYGHWIWKKWNSLSQNGNINTTHVFHIEPPCTQ